MCRHIDVLTFTIFKMLRSEGYGSTAEAILHSSDFRLHKHADKESDVMPADEKVTTTGAASTAKPADMVCC